MDCRICKEKILNPTQLPCTHQYCLICIKRHLSKRNFCPECYLAPLCDSDIIVQNTLLTSPIFKHVKNNSLLRYTQNTNIQKSKLPVLSAQRYHRMNIEQLRVECKKYKISIGSKKDMVLRLKEFYMLCEIERNTENSANADMIASYVNKNMGNGKDINVEKIVMKHLDNIILAKQKLKEKVAHCSLKKHI